MIRAGAALALVLAAGCAANNNNKTPDPVDSARVETILTASAPERDFAAPVLVSPPSTVTITIVRIENPSLEGVSVHATFLWTGPNGMVQKELGSVAPFPANQPGAFMIGVPADVKDLVVRKDGTGRVHLALEPVTADHPLIEPLKVTFNDPLWR